MTGGPICFAMLYGRWARSGRGLFRVRFRYSGAAFAYGFTGGLPAGPAS